MHCSSLFYLRLFNFDDLYLSLFAQLYMSALIVKLRNIVWLTQSVYYLSVAEYGVKVAKDLCLALTCCEKKIFINEKKKKA